MLDADTKRRIDTARDILVGKVPDPKSQVEQITIALIYKFMDDMDAESEEWGGERTFFAGDFARYGWAKLMRPDSADTRRSTYTSEAITRMPENPGIPPLFRDIFNNAYLPYRDPETLRAFLKVIDEFTYDHSERLGDAFEYLLSVLGAQGDAGQFRTPRHIIDFIVEIIDPKKRRSNPRSRLRHGRFPHIRLQAHTRGQRRRRRPEYAHPRREGPAGLQLQGLRHIPRHGAPLTRQYVPARLPTARTSTNTTPSPAKTAGPNTPTSYSPTRPSCRRAAESGHTTASPSSPGAARSCSWTTWPNTSPERTRRIHRPRRHNLPEPERLQATPQDAR